MLFRAAMQSKERESIPLHASHIPGHGAEGFIDPLLIAKTRRQYFYGYGLALELAAEPLPWGVTTPSVETVATLGSELL